MLDFTDAERGVLLMALRIERRHNARKRRALVRQFGSEVRPEAIAQRDTIEELICSAYRKLGGDPTRMTNVPDSDFTA